MACVAVLGRRALGRQCRGFLCAYFKKPTAERICHVAKLTHDTYTKFFSGQCIEVLILGTMIFLAFSVFRILDATERLSALFMPSLLQSITDSLTVSQKDGHLCVLFCSRFFLIESADKDVRMIAAKAAGSAG